MVAIILYFSSVSPVRNDEILHNIGAYLYYLFTDALGQVNVTSSISGRNSCPSEEVTFTCIARGHVIFWGNEGFGEITVHYQSPPTRGNFRAVVVSYNRSQNCLVSSLSLRANASHNGTTVTCTSGDRSSSESLSLHIISSEFVRHILAVDKLLMKRVMKASIMCSLDILGRSLFL